MKVFKKFVVYFYVGFGIWCFSGSELWGGKWTLEILSRDIQGENNTVACARPTLPEGRCVRIEEASKCTVYTTVGHGGSGWSNGPGHVKSQIDIFFKSHEAKGVPISVVGDGLISRVWRYHLVQGGYTNITVCVDPDEDLPRSASYNATGIYSPDMSSEREIKAAQDTLEFYKEVNRAVDGLVCLTSVHVISNVFIGGFPKEASKDPQGDVLLVDDHATVEIVSEGKRLKSYPDILIYKVPAIHNRRILKGLENYLQIHAPQEKRRFLRVKELSQLETPIVIDASGWGMGVAQNYAGVGHQTFENPGHFNLKLGGEGSCPILPVGLNIRVDGKSRFPLGDASCIRYLHFVGHGDYQVLGGTWENYAQMAEKCGVSENVFKTPEYDKLNGLQARWRRSVWLGLQDERAVLEGLIQELGRTSFPTIPMLWEVPGPLSDVFRKSRGD